MTASVSVAVVLIALVSASPAATAAEAERCGVARCQKPGRGPFSDCSRGAWHAESEYGRVDGTLGYHFGPAGAARRPALALDIRGFGRPMFQFLAFPGEEPPSIECNEDAGQEFTDE